jgi:hypothetical protein
MHVFNSIFISFYNYNIIDISQKMHGFMYYRSFKIQNDLSHFFTQGKLNNIQDRVSPCRRTFLVSKRSVILLKAFTFYFKLTWKTFCTRECVCREWNISQLSDKRQPSTPSFCIVCLVSGEATVCGGSYANFLFNDNV